jgi:predicted metal-dependent hydrolase
MTMPLDWTCGALAKGLRCYQAEEFFLAHEHWEGAWLQSEQPDKTFLQALIQVTAAFHHLQRNNPAGTASLLRAALRRLESYPDLYGDLEVASLRESIHAWLHALDKQETAPNPAFPPIRPITPL